MSQFGCNVKAGSITQRSDDGLVYLQLRFFCLCALLVGVGKGRGWCARSLHLVPRFQKALPYPNSAAAGVAQMHPAEFARAFESVSLRHAFTVAVQHGLDE